MCNHDNVEVVYVPQSKETKTGALKCCICMLKSKIILCKCDGPIGGIR